MEQDEEARRVWREQIQEHDASTIVVVDETATNIGLTPLYARAPKGQRARDRIPRNRGKNTTVIASLTLSGMGPALMLEGASDTLAFECYVEQLLAPSLEPGQIVVMDNLSSHKGPRVREMIESRGCLLLFLPSYSPDLSPIEEAFSKFKTILRRMGARTRDALQDAIAQALEAITSQDALGWFTHCGYFPAIQEVS